MITIKARNVNEALRLGVMHLKVIHREIAPRDGEMTWEYPSPIVTEYRYPDERVMTIPERDANPFFHFFESLWVLAGRKDVAFLDYFNGNMSRFSDDGVNFNAPYGWRLREQFGIDQLEFAIRMLQENPDTRRCVMQIWGVNDLDLKSKDIPCNDLIFFKIRDNKLQMTVLCRSNDIIWGAYGTNAVQFSMIQEYVARRLKIQMGTYYQFSDSFHAYLNKQWETLVELDVTGHCPYDLQEVRSYPLMDSGREVFWNMDLARFMNFELVDKNYENGFFYEVADPMLNCWIAHKENSEGLHLTHDISASDWRYAVEQWLRVRENYDE